MSNARYDLGAVSKVGASAIGEPGNRQFRITAEGPGGSAMVWLEKQQLQELALAIHRILAMDPTQRRATSLTQASPAMPPQNLDFRASAISLEYEDASQTLQIEADDNATQAGARPIVRFLVSREQGYGLAEMALEVCAAGRPQCPLCFAPMNPGEKHICPMSNGHAKRLA